MKVKSSIRKEFPKMSANLKNRIKEGVALLDESYPNWYKHINLEKLDIQFKNECILGQLYGNYNFTPLARTQNAVKYGFYLKHVNPKKNWSKLTLEWKKAVLERQNKDNIVINKSTTKKQSFLSKVVSFLF